MMSETVVNGELKENGAGTSVRARQWRSRLIMVGLFLTFFGPIFLAMFLYSHLDIWHPAGTANHGELLVPIHPLETLDLVDDETGDPVTMDSIKGRWTLIFVGEGGCDLACEASLFKVRQTRILLGRELRRVRYLFLSLDDKASQAAKAISDQHPRMMRATAAPGLADRQAAAFGEHPQGNLYLIDPLGNLVMRYGSDAKARGILKDLHRLLRVSKIG